MWLNSLLSFLRITPTLDFLILLIAWVLVYSAWCAAKHDPKEDNAEKRQAGASAITNQINGTLTAASIILAGVGAVLVVGFDKSIPQTAVNHLTWAAVLVLFSIGIGIYTLGYIPSPSVIHKMDVTKKPAVQLACLLQLGFVMVSTVRFLFALLHISGVFPLF